MQFKNIVALNWVDSEHTKINLQVDIVELNLTNVTFVADKNDVEEHGRTLFNLAEAGDFGPINEPAYPEIKNIHTSFYIPDAPVIPIVPTEVTMRQARLILFARGLLATIDNIIANLPGADGDAARIEWEYAGTVSRSSPLFQTLMPSLGVSPSDLDTMFIEAAKL